MAFVQPSYRTFVTKLQKNNELQSSVALPYTSTRRQTELKMGLDMVTYLRTEWVSAALCTNQTPRAAKSVLQIGTEDGRAVNFVPRTVEELITSSAEEDGKLSVTCKRQLKQQRDRRGTGIAVRYVDQAADNLSQTRDESVDVVISLQASDRMRENGMDWVKSLKEAARVLKPGGRLLFVEKTDIEGVGFLDVLMGLRTVEDESDESEKVDGEEENDDEEVTNPIFEMVGYDDVDLVIVPHVAGVVIKSENAGLTIEEIESRKAMEEKARIADLSISAFERGLKKRRRKKGKKNSGEDETETASS